MFETADYLLELQAQNQLKIVVNYLKKTGQSVSCEVDQARLPYIMISTGILVKIFQQMVMVFFCTKNRNGIDFYYLQNTITCKFMSPFHSTKTFENLATAANGTEISRNVNHSNSRFSGSKVEIMERKLPGINFRKIRYTLRGCPVFGNFAPSFALGSCRKFKPNVLVEWKALSASSQNGNWH